MARILDTRKDLRPREKLLKKGASSLSDTELLMVVIGSGNAMADVSKIARDTLKVLQSTQQSRLAPKLAEIRAVDGIGDAKAAQLLACFELTKRHLAEPAKPIIDSPEKAAQQLAFIRNKKQEHFVCITLDGANRLIAKRIITIGTLTASLVHPREVFADAITDRAASIIVGHNHPSGSLDASVADREVTERLREAGELLGVALLDHIIITKDSFMKI